MYYTQYLTVTKEVGDRAGEGGAYCNLGNAMANIGNLEEEALDYHKEYLKISKEVGDRAGEGKAYCNLGNAYHSMGNLKQAMEYHEDYLIIVKELGDRAGEGIAHGNLGDMHYGLGDLEKAIYHHEEHLAISKKIGDTIGEGNACYSLGLDHEMSGSLCEALSYYRLSIEHFDETRHLLQSEDAWKISFRDRYRAAYVALWRGLLKNGETDKALWAAERGRAQALMDILKVQYGVEALPSSTVAPKEGLSAVLKNLPTQTVFTALDKNTISFWLTRKGSIVHFEQKNIENGSAESLMETTLEQISAGADISFENQTLDLSCNRNPAEETSQSVNFPFNSLRPLYDVLISPIADLLEGDELVFVPDGPFCLAPYSALSGSIRIRTVPSLTALKVIAGAPDDSFCESEALLVGDPCLEEVTDKNGEPTWEQLPSAIEEVEMIGELLQTTPLTGRNATKAEVLKRLNSVALVHIAAHGDDEFGEIVLAPNPERTSQMPDNEDYMLTMDDVHAVRLRARLVVLSCCHSGQGKVKSEGVVGIARAFLCAGARSVLVSLWAIDDKATAMFMRSFYQHLVGGKRASVAVHQAMKSLQESQQYSALKFWAPFVLIGDDVTFEFGQNKVKENGKSFYIFFLKNVHCLLFVMFLEAQLVISF